MTPIWEWITDNKNWLFSGLLVLPLGLFLTWLIQRKKRAKPSAGGVHQQVGVNVTGKSITFTGNNQTINFQPPGSDPKK